MSLLTPRCPGAGQTSSQSLPHRRALFARAERRHCLGGELQANFRLGDSQAAGLAGTAGVCLLAGSCACGSPGLLRGGTFLPQPLL